MLSSNGTPRIHRCGHCGKALPRARIGAACPIGGDCCGTCAAACKQLGHCQLK